MKKNIDTSRGTFHVRIFGKKEAPPLFLLHGFPQTGLIWEDVIPFLQDFYVIAPDLRGMGDSNRDLTLDLYQKDEMARDIFAIADTLDVDHFHLCGHDWGGAVAQEMIFSDPKRILSLIVLNIVILNNSTGLQKAFEKMVPQMFRSSWYWFFMSIKEFPEAMIEGKEEIWVRFFSRGISNPIPESSVQEFIRCYKIPHSITTMSNIYRTVPKDRKRWASYAGKIINTPTCIIHGILDPVIIPEYLEGVEAYFTNLQIVKLKGGHFIVDEQPEGVGGAISSFLKTL